MENVNSGGSEDALWDCELLKTIIVVLRKELVLYVLTHFLSADFDLSELFNSMKTTYLWELLVKGTVMQIEKALINDRLRNSKGS